MKSKPTLRRPWALLSVAVAAIALAGCNKAEERTVGQQVDATIAKADNAAQRAGAEVKQESAEAKAAAERAVEKAGQAVEKATDKVVASTADAVITAAVNAELAKDADLSALKIDVDTRDGRVVLQGTAPSKTARERASTLAASVKGVAGVDNRLQVRS